MRKNYFKFILLSALIILCGCASEVKQSLDIENYLALVTSPESIYPSAEQIKLLDDVVPKESYSPAPSISDRVYWDKIAASAEGKEELSRARAVLELEPEVPISDEIYRRANKEGNRAIFKPRYYDTMARLENYLLAECIENKGVFIPQIEKYCSAILNMKSWMHPNHDDDDNGVLEGRRVAIDLSARKFGLVLSLVDALLEDKISAELKGELSEQLRWRIIDSYLDSSSGKDKISNDWLRKTNNWNSVCSSGTIFTVITTDCSREERLAAIGSALNGMRYYLSGFGDDGYCSEGVGYWNYGFGHYLYLAHILYDYTDGAIDLFNFDNPQKMINVANFPQNYEIQNGMYTPFSDGVTSVAKDNDNFAYLMCAKYYGTPKPLKFYPDEAVFTIIGWDEAAQYTTNGIEEETKLPAHTYFDKYGIVISRGAQQIPLSISIKAGHNAENHNHSDVGSYYILLGDDCVAGDIGAPSYLGNIPSKIHPARNSWGHPVPRVDNNLQSIGREFEGTITRSEFTMDRDYVEMQLEKAYEVPALNSITRSMTNDKSGSGKITIVDKFTAKEPIMFGTAIMVNTKYEVKGDKLYIFTDNYRVRVDISADGAPVKIVDEQVVVNAPLRSGKTSYRIGVDFTKPLTEGSIEVVYTPEIK